jgi:hypothetical protein
MDGYEYEAKVLWPMWNKEREEKTKFMSQNASDNNSTRERLKNELGIKIQKDPLDVAENLRNKIVGNPDNFYPELSSDNLVWDLGRRFRNQR